MLPLIREVGAFEVIALPDADGPFPQTAASAFPEATAEAWERAHRFDPTAFGPDDTWLLDFRCFAVRGSDGRVVLVDAGIGPADSLAASWAPVPGHLPSSLAAVGIKLEDVETVVLTHLHSDHSGWAVGSDGAPYFPNARYVVQETETRSCQSAVLTRIVEPLRKAGVLQEISGLQRLIGIGDSTLTAVLTPGHTAGHQSVYVEGGAAPLIITGDVAVHAVQLTDPDVAYIFEDDPDEARRTRRALLNEARRRGAALATPHLRQAFVQMSLPENTSSASTIR